MTSEEKQIAKEIVIAIIQKSGSTLTVEKHFNDFGDTVSKLYLTICDAVTKTRDL